MSSSSTSASDSSGSAFAIRSPSRAIGFYESVLGWRFEAGWEYDTPQGRETYWHIRTGSASERRSPELFKLGGNIKF